MSVRTVFAESRAAPRSMPPNKSPRPTTASLMAVTTGAARSQAKTKAVPRTEPKAVTFGRTVSIADDRKGPICSMSGTKASFAARAIGASLSPTSDQKAWTAGTACPTSLVATSNTASVRGAKPALAAAPILENWPPRVAPSAAAAFRAPLLFWSPCTYSSIANLPPRIVSAMSAPARAPKMSIAMAVASEAEPAALIDSTAPARPCRRSMPLSANLPAAMRREPMTSSVLTPSLCHLPSMAAASSTLNPKLRSGAPNCTVRRDSSSTPTPVSWLALKSLSSCSACLSVAMPQSPNRRVTPLMLAAASVPVIFESCRICLVSPSRAGPV